MTLYVILPKCEQRTPKYGPNGRVLDRVELEAGYPRSPHDQHFLGTILECVRQERAERSVQRIGAAALAMEQRRRELDMLTNTFAEVVMGGLRAVGLNEGDAVCLRFRAKSPNEIVRKHTVGAYRQHVRGKAWHALPDLPAGELVLRAGCCTNPDKLMDDLQQHYDVPDVYPGGQRAREQGSTSHISVAGFHGRKLRLAFWHEGEIHIGELRIWDENEKAADDLTRDEYVARRENEHDEALKYFRGVYQDDALDQLPTAPLY